MPSTVTGLQQDRIMFNPDTCSVLRSFQKHVVCVLWHGLSQYTQITVWCTNSAKQRPEFPRMNYFDVFIELEMDLWLFYKTIGVFILLTSSSMYHSQIIKPFINACDVDCETDKHTREKPLPQALLLNLKYLASCHFKCIALHLKQTSLVRCFRSMWGFLIPFGSLSRLKFLRSCGSIILSCGYHKTLYFSLSTTTFCCFPHK